MRRVGFLAGVATVLILAIPATAGATIEGPCTGSGTWSDGGPSVDAGTADTVEIPLAATVTYTGAVAVPEASRAVNGFIRVKLPPPIGSITLGDWDTTAVEVSKTGTYTYDFPSVLAGFDITVTGEHNEPGNVTCTGTVTLRFAGGNPLGIASLFFTAVAALGVFISMRARPARRGSGGSGVVYESGGGA